MARFISRLFSSRSFCRPIPGLAASAITLSLIPLVALAPAAHAGNVTWTGSAGTGFWDTAGNWNPALPGSADDVFNLIGATITHRSGTDTIRSLTTNGNILVSGGTLTLATSLTFNAGGSLTLSGGALAGAQISDSTRLSFANNANSVLSNVSLIGDGTTVLNVGDTSNFGRVRIADSFSFSNGSVINVGTTSVSGALFFDSTAGTPNPTLNNATVNLGFDALLGFGQGYSVGNTLTLGSNLLVQGGGYIGFRAGFYAATGANLVNNGTISSTQILDIATGTNGNITNNGTMQMGSTNGVLRITTSGTGTFTNNGSVLISGTAVASSINGNVAKLGNVSITGPVATLNLNANLTTSQLSGLSLSNGGRLNLGNGLGNGTLNNAGATLDVASLVGASGEKGTLALVAYRIQGGIIANSHLLRFSTSAGNYLDNVALVGDGTTLLNVGSVLGGVGATGYAHLANNVTFSNGNVFNVGRIVGTINSGSALPGYLFLDSTAGTPNPTLDNAIVNLGDPAGDNGNLVFGDGYSAGRTLTLGTNLLVQGKGTVGNYVPSGATGANLVNNGTISANIDFAPLNVLGTTNGNLTNNGTIQAVANSNTLNITTSGTGTLTNNGVIRATNASTVNISGTTARLGTLTTTGGGRINLAGTITNTGQTLDVASVVGATGANGSLYLNGATINGGTITRSDLLSFTQTTNILSNVSLSGDGTNILRLGVNGTVPIVRIADSFSFTNGSTFQVAPGTSAASLLFDSTTGTPNPTFDNAIVNLGSSTANGNLGFGNGYTTGRTLTLGSNLVVQGRQGIIGATAAFNPTGTTLINNGLIQSNVTSGSLTITSGNNGAIINNGTLRANATGSSLTLRVNGTGTSFTNNGTLFIQAGSTGSITAQSIVQSGGSTLINGVLTILSGTTTYTVNGGDLGGSGSLTGNVNNVAGVFQSGEAGSTGKFTLSGTYTQGSTATFFSEIGGDVQGDLYDFLSVGGNASLGGNLSVALLNGFVPVFGSQFEILRYGSNTGATTFFNTSNNQIVTRDGSYRFNVLYSSTGVSLQAVGNASAAPEPGSLFLALTSLIPCAALARRRA